MQLDSKRLEEIIKTALAEDIDHRGDVTSSATIPEASVSSALVVVREPSVVCGLVVLEPLFAELDSKTQVTLLSKEGESVVAGTALARIEGKTRILLQAERVALNMMQHMSGVATLTARYVKVLEGLNVDILDTRKTLPGLREIEKYAVRVGGGNNHRMSLSDAILIKDNHIHACGGLTRAVEHAKEVAADMTIEVECDTMQQVEEALSAGVDKILLDNMDSTTLRRAVELIAKKAWVEASGGITLETLKEVASTGVDAISIGALTHSAPNIDIGLDWS